jgi:hypothetical protein
MQSQNSCMKTLSRRLRREYFVRKTCLIAAGSLFLFSVSALVLGAGGDVGVWRGLALGSLYLSTCLMRRRLFVPSSRMANRPEQRSQLAH